MSENVPAGGKSPEPASSQEKRQRSSRAISSFLVGFTAGTAPFVVIFCLPPLLTPGAAACDIPYKHLLLFGTMVGITAAIIFTEQVKKQWQDVFVYSLGIPALLIATVGDISGKLNTSEFQARMSTEVLAPNRIPAEIDSGFEIVPMDEINLEQENTTNWLHRLMYSEAVAVQPDTARARLLSRRGQYLIAIGTYSDKRAAIRDYRKYQSKKFKTQSYVNKSLDILKWSDQYMLVYWRGHDGDLAEKVYKLLRINDPDVPVQLYQTGG